VYLAQSRTAVNIVAITDGARVIRNRLFGIFGRAVVVILDWYHLRKKLRDMISMIVVTKIEKTIHLKFLLPQLCQGKTTTALEYLNIRVVLKIRTNGKSLLAI